MLGHSVWPVGAQIGCRELRARDSGHLLFFRECFHFSCSDATSGSTVDGEQELAAIEIVDTESGEDTCAT